MSQMSDLGAYDGAATPVYHTLVGEDITRLPDGTVVTRWKESTVGVPDVAQVRCTMKKRKLPSGVFRVSARFEVPVMESVSGQNAAGYTAPPKVAFVDTVEVVGYFHERSTVTSRRLVRQLAANVMGNIGTSVAPQTAGPLPQLFDQLIAQT